MKRIVVGFLKIILALILLLNLYILISGKFYVYSVLKNTVFKGRLGPTINEYNKDYKQLIETGNFIKIPESIKYNQQQISNEFSQYIQQFGTVSFLVLKNDSILHEEYWDGWNNKTLSNSYSMAKSFVSLLVGCALHDGLIKNIDESICNYLPDFNCEVNKNVTIKNLLTMSSAIDFDESYISPFSYAAEALYGNNLKEATYQHKVVNEPGKVFDYQSGNTQLLSMILEKVTGKKLAEYASEKLWKPLGASLEAYWSLDSENGLARAFCCYISNARDFSRFGMLLNHHGKCGDVQVIDSTYLVQATTPATWLKDEDGKACNKYGFQFWMLNYKGLKINYCRGILGQYIICIPSKQIVAVRLGHKRSKEKIDGHPVDLYKIIDETLRLISN